MTWHSQCLDGQAGFFVSHAFSMLGMFPWLFSILPDLSVHLRSGATMGAQSGPTSTGGGGVRRWGGHSLSFHTLNKAIISSKMPEGAPRHTGG